MEYVLILFMSIGALSDKDSMALTTVAFPVQQQCVAAGDAAVKKFGTGTKNAAYVCVPRGRS